MSNAFRRKLFLIFWVIALPACNDNEPSEPTIIKNRFVTTHLGYSELPNGRGGISYESVAITHEMNFDKTLSLKAFEETLYPYLKSLNCNKCHSTETTNAAGAQSPLHSDIDVNLAHEYALTTVNFKNPVTSKIIEQMAIYRHHCPNTCANDALSMLTEIESWKDRIQSTLYETPRAIKKSVTVSDDDIEAWINTDKESLPTNDAEFMVYASLHELHNNSVTADELNIVRVGLSKALNSVARWAPKIVNPIDVNSKGILYRFDIRDYWGWNKGVAKLLYGGSDDDMYFGQGKTDYLGEIVGQKNLEHLYNFADTIEFNPGLATLVWQRILHGNVEGAKLEGNIRPNINGFHGELSNNEAGDYIPLNTLKWVEATQLIYTLTRPDVYNSIMMNPMNANQLEDELGVDKSKGMDSYDYFLTFDAMAVDSQFSWRAKRIKGGFYRKTFDVFSTHHTGGERSIFEIYKEGGRDIHFPFWANPIPTFIDPNLLDPEGERAEENWSFVATLAQPYNVFPPGCDLLVGFGGINTFRNCRHFTGSHGLQQSFSQMMWDLPNGLLGYMLASGQNNRTLAEPIHIARDPRRIKEADDRIATHTDLEFSINPQQRAGANSPRLLVGSSCIGCHVDGIKRSNNDLRDWLDHDQDKLPKGRYGADEWLTDETVVKRVKELYPSSSQSHEVLENERKHFLEAMVKIKQKMIVGVDKNMYVEPVIWSVEYAQNEMYNYPQVTSN